MVTALHTEAFDENDHTDLATENEILKLKIQAEHGAMVFTEPDLPPEIEAEFLQHIYAFEQAWQNVKMIRICDLLNNPPFRKLAELSKNEVESELASLIQLLGQYQISIEIPDSCTPADAYRFITEILFEQEVDDLKMEGLVRHFFYNPALI